jgi:hypothetical protein
MKITVSTAGLSPEQHKFLAQLGEFKETRECSCDLDELDAAVEQLRRAGIKTERGRVRMESRSVVPP